MKRNKKKNALTEVVVAEEAVAEVVMVETDMKRSVLVALLLVVAQDQLTLRMPTDRSQSLKLKMTITHTQLQSALNNKRKDKSRQRLTWKSTRITSLHSEEMS